MNNTKDLLQAALSITIKPSSLDRNKANVGHDQFRHKRTYLYVHLKRFTRFLGPDQYKLFVIYSSFLFLSMPFHLVDPSKSDP